MSLASTNVELAYAGVANGVPIVAPIPAFAQSEILVYYGDTRLLAVQGVDYNVVLDVPDPLNPPPPNTVDYQFVTVTPTASLITKIGAGTNIIYIHRTLPLTTAFSPTDAFTRDNIDVEFVRTLMRVQELQWEVNQGLVANPSNIDAALSATAAAASAAAAAVSAAAALVSQNAAAGTLASVVASATAAASSATQAATSATNAAASAVLAASIAATIAFLPLPNTGAVGQALVVNAGQTAYTFADIQPLDADLTAIAAYSAAKMLQLNGLTNLSMAVGFIAQTAANVFTPRSLVAGTGISLTNASGGGGDPSISINQGASLTWTASQTVSVTGLAVFSVIGTTGVTFSLDSAAATNRLIQFATGGLGRWKLFADTTAEGGANAGSNFTLNAYDDAGSLIGGALTIARSTRAVTATVSLVSPTVNASTTLQVGGTDIFARANTWSADQTLAKASPNLTIQGSSGNSTFHITGVAATQKQIQFETGGSLRWKITSNATAEGGANAGSDFEINSYTDAGAFFVNALTINRATGAVTVGNGTGAGLTVANGGITSLTNQLNVTGGGVMVGAPTGGNKGAGTINASNVYDDNVLLTCYVLEAANTNAIDVVKWDATIPTTALPDGKTIRRQHRPARQFAANRLDDLDLDKFVTKWKTNGYLPSMPSPQEWADRKGLAMGDVVQRLWEQAELYAVHAAALNDRLKRVEQRAA